MREEWRAVPGYEAYEVSSLGRVRKGSQILDPRVTTNGYERIRINGKEKAVHRLVADAFIGHAEGEIDHIDGNKVNNAVDNLRWVTRSENVRHSYSLGRRKARGGSKGVPIKMVTSSYEIVFKSIAAGARAVNRSHYCVWKAAKSGGLCAGARWEYA